MNYIVLDLEWNQSNTGEEPEVEKIPFEIIEIGAIKLNNERNITGEFSQLVKPQVYHEMHGITQGLVHMQMKELEKGRPFPEVAQEFLEWCGEEDYIFCTWGPLDLIELQRNLRFYNMPVLAEKPFAYYDVQKLFSLAFEDKKSRRTLEHAVDTLSIEKDIPFHRAFSDAYYTARVLQLIRDPEILAHYSYDVFHLPNKREEEVRVLFDDYAKYISRGFSDKAALLNDREVMSTKCYYCHRNLKRKVKWFTPNGKHYYAVSYCDNHGFMKAKVRVRKGENGDYYAIKTSKFISEEEAVKIKNKKNDRRHI
ncbi:MAG: exonuclease domain-containing protein [Lachnospiraceae bacterium]|nr:exonuclease domain-containing protein [Lachnospiraceae bacterium]